MKLDLDLVEVDRFALDLKLNDFLWPLKFLDYCRYVSRILFFKEYLILMLYHLFGMKRFCERMMDQKTNNTNASIILDKQAYMIYMGLSLKIRF